MKRLFIYFSLFIMVAGNASCDKQLSALPKNAKVDANTIIDQPTAQVALNGAYYRFAQVSTNNVTDWTTHQVFGGMIGGQLDYAFGSMPEASNNNVNSGYAPQVWDQNYLLLNAANGLIEGVNKVADAAFTGTRKQGILSEGRFLRAYAHFKLLSTYAEWFDVNSKYGVLLREEPSTLTNIPKARSTVAESYKSILDDLDYAIANGSTTNPNYYVSKWAAMALKMRVLIGRGQQGDYAEVINLGNTILGSGPYVLESNLKDLFHSKGLSSKEVILGVKPQVNQEQFYYILSRSYYPFASSGFVATKAFRDLLQNDPRGTWVIGPANNGASYSTPNTFYFSKYIPYGAATSQVTETSYALRLSEVYLLMAEATIRSGGDLATARTHIKTVMGKGGVTDFSAIDNAAGPDALLVQTYYETVRNLTGEDGIEWLALLRLPFNTVKQLRPTITNKVQYIFPIPAGEFKQNVIFGDQNPGYTL